MERQRGALLCTGTVPVMVIDTGFHEVSAADVPRILGEAARQGVLAFTLSTAGRTDQEAFFKAVRTALPLDPPLGTARMVWEALADSLWGGLDALKAPRVVIVWPDARPVADAQGEKDRRLPHSGSRNAGTARPRRPEGPWRRLLTSVRPQRFGVRRDGVGAICS